MGSRLRGNDGGGGIWVKGEFSPQRAQRGIQWGIRIWESGIRRGLLLRSTGKGGFETRPYGDGGAIDTYTAMSDWVSPAARASM